MPPLMLQRIISVYALPSRLARAAGDRVRKAGTHLRLSLQQISRFMSRITIWSAAGFTP